MGDFSDSSSNLRHSNYIICEEHVLDEDLGNIFRKYGTPYGECDICGKVVTDWDFHNPFFIDFQTLFEKIKKCIELEFGDAWDILPYDNEEEQFIGEPIPTRDLIEELCQNSCDEDLIEWIIDQFDFTHEWSNRNTHSDFEESEELYYSWNSFSDLVKNKIRYLFFDFEEKRTTKRPNKPFDILREIGDYITEQKMFIVYPEFGDLFNQNPKIYRARQHKLKREVLGYKDICSPLPKFAKSNRFTPEGISMFYGAECPNTAISEVVNKAKPNEFISVAEFRHNRKLRLIDLRDPKLIGFFDEHNSHKRQASFFIRKFVREITKPIDYQKQIGSIEYIPSQIITEYFRFILTKLGHKVDGMVYRSSKTPGKNCYVFFAESGDCIDEGRSTSDHLLVMEKNSIVTKKVKEML